MMDNQARGLIKGLENWAKRVTTGYKDVNVQNMSSSFRNGLAFCAIIHHYRPDLIDFDSLSKDNIFENNSLAFSTAEKQLGVPALLEAKDMVEYSHPDRLSIITYLSQLYNCFENQNKVRAMQSGFKRPLSNSTGPPSKVSHIQPKLLSTNRNDTCHVCNHRVFILERLIVDSKLYHTTCFRCNKCNCLLNPGTYVDSDTPGLYECAVCMPDENSDSMETVSIGSSDSKTDSLGDVPVKPYSPLSKVPEKPQLSDKVTVARSNFLQHSLSPKSPEPLKVSSPVSKNGVESPGSVTEKEESTANGVSVKAKINAFESNRNSKPESFFQTSESDSSSKLKLSSSINASNNNAPPPNKSLRNSAILSVTITPNSKLNGSLQSPDKTSKNSSSVEILGAPDLKIASKPLNSSIPSSDISSPQSDKPNCDTLASPSILNRVPSPSARRSLLLQSPTTKEEVGNKFTTKQFVGDYKSPLKTSRDIFQTNLQPLKLSIPSVNSSSRNESTSSSLTSSVTSPESVKSGGFEIPQIRSTYARTLPRPGSASSLILSKDKPNEASSHSENNLSDVLHSKWSRTTPRRSSFDSVSKTEIHNETIDSKSVNIGKNEVDSDTTKSTENQNLFFQRDHNTPIPSVRRSLESKNLNLGKPPSPPLELESPHKPLNTSSQIFPPDQLEGSQKVEKTMLEGATAAKQEKLYPDDLNPFGDDEEEEDEYPDDLNPFGDDEEVTPTQPPKVIRVEDYDEAKNPFASDDEDTDVTPSKAKPPRPELPKLQRDLSSPSGNSLRDSPFASMSNSPSGTLKGTLKKRPAPRPPRVTDIFPNDSNDSEADVSINSLRSSPAVSRKSLQTPSPKLRKNKPAPPPPPVPPGKQVDAAASSKQMKDEDNMKLKSGADGGHQAKAKKKRPAPPVPIPKRKDNKKIPLKEILREMKEIEEKQRECERQGREIELLIRDRDKDEEASVEEEEYIMQLFELVNQKNALFRRQAELMYIKRSQRLEEQQSELETQIRQLMQKPEEEKNDEDRAKEEELILELKDIVDQRSSIIDSIEMDRRRELEEDASVQDQMEIKNGELPIPAEIKVKTKKFKLKKDKKKKKEENENGEPKKKEKKKWLSK